MKDHKHESMIALQVITHLYDGDPLRAAERFDLLDDEVLPRHVAALQALAVQFLGVIDGHARAAESPDVRSANAKNLLAHLGYVMEMTDSIDAQLQRVLQLVSAAPSTCSLIPADAVLLMVVVVMMRAAGGRAERGGEDGDGHNQ